METRRFGKTAREVSAIGLGTWQLGSEWGNVPSDTALEILDTAHAAGITLFDTADVYGDGRSESFIGQWLTQNAATSGFQRPTVITKMGRRVEQDPANYHLKNFRAWTDRSRRNLGMDTLDLVQLHCPPTATITADATYDALDELVNEKVMAGYGVSVETCEQALAAIERPGVASVQIILNAFRLKPLDQVLPAAKTANVAIIARVPLASGLLSGKYSSSTTFAFNDHRSFNRAGKAFDRGETFSGVDYHLGLRAAAEFGDLVARTRACQHHTQAQAALAWVAQLPAVTTVIPGARSPQQVLANAAAGDVPDLGAKFTAEVNGIYDRLLRTDIHPYW